MSGVAHVAFTLLSRKEPPDMRTRRVLVQHERQALLRRLAEIEQAQEVANKLDLLIEQAEEPVVLRWDMRFRSDIEDLAYGFDDSVTIYSYAAIYIERRGWYTTGPHSPKGYSTQEFAEWLTQNEIVDGLWFVSEYEPVGI